MPTYTFRHKETGEEKTEIMSISSMEKFLKKNKTWEHIFVKAPMVGDQVSLGRQKPPQEFRNLLKRIKKNNRGSTINVI